MGGRVKPGHGEWVWINSNQIRSETYAACAAIGSGLDVASFSMVT